MIHILGAGAIGQLHAHYLTASKIPNMLLTRNVLGNERKVQQVQLLITNPQKIKLSSTAILDPLDGDSIISHLIVCTKSHQCMQAIKNIAHRLTPNPIIILLQNGVLKVHQEVLIFFKASNMPVSLLAGLTSHGVTTISQFDKKHVGIGSTTIGCLDPALVNNLPVKDMLNTLQVAWQPLGIKVEHGAKLKKQLLVKLVVNAVINPLAALLGCQNGGIAGKNGPHMIKSLCQEALSALPELGDVSLDEMASNVMQVVLATSKNQNSMDRDLSNGQETEINYINGYLIDEAKKNSIKIPAHELLLNLIEHKLEMKKI